MFLIEAGFTMRRGAACDFGDTAVEDAFFVTKEALTRVQPDVRLDEAGRRWWRHPTRTRAPLSLPPNAAEGRSALSPYVSKRPRGIAG